MTDYPLLLSATIPFLIALFFFFFFRQSPRRASDFPPGPPPIPILGNIHQIPLQKSYIKFAKWAQQYGPIVGLRLGPQRAIVLNTWTAVRDLLDQRGAIYSSRPTIPLIEHMGITDTHPAFMKYTKNWRRARKSMAEYLKDSEVDKRMSIQDAESSQMMWEILQRPGEYKEAVERSFAAVMLDTVYGRRGTIDVTKRFFKIQDEWTALLDPGAMPPFDVLPFLRYVPDWLTPWRGWRQRAEALKQKKDGVYRGLFQDARERVVQGKVDDSFVARLLEEQEKEGYTDYDLEYVAGLLLEGGADTASTAFSVFVLAMAVFPELQRKAQEEVDGVFGKCMPAAPEGADATKLPYLKACFWEILRWRPGFPTGVPHATTKDDTYQGYSIPANTTVILNTWAIEQNPVDHTSPNAFDPTRFLTSKFGTTHPESDAPPTEADAWRRQSYAFGAGRRVCPGQRMAENSMLLAMAKVVWAFDIVSLEGEGELDLSMETGFTDAFLTAPKEGRIGFEIRGERRREVVEREWERADGLLKRFE
ncbi:cytochrome P450 [Lentithecium fluviatile CBS 122367]|uniref:Cytochrome P450 n=1 Tax=Lentithecium fluviatile CBS 122367 TaxID=1168545 RepID=A0A6G1IH53_9PLEO|nr:cytochrome P450 [Lentithecium fluviatile CBS 122367]